MTILQFEKNQSICHFFSYYPLASRLLAAFPGSANPVDGCYILGTIFHTDGFKPDPASL